MNYLTKKKIPNVLITMSFVDIFIFLKGLLDGKGCILNTIYKRLEIVSLYFHISLHLVPKRTNKYSDGNNI